MFRNNKKENPTSSVQFQEIKNGIIPNFSYLEHKIKSQLPTGCIIPWLGGYFTATDNVGYNPALGSTNDVAGTNSYIGPKGWNVCDGTLKIDIESPIFNGSNRFLPKTTDNIFISSGLVLGSIGGNNNFSDHIHNLFSINLNQTSFSSSITNNKHRHSFQISASSVGNHRHGLTVRKHGLFDQYCSGNGASTNFYFSQFAGGSNSNGSSHNNLSISIQNQTVTVDYSHSHGATPSSISAIIDASDPTPSSISKIVKNLSCFIIMRIK